MNRKCPLIFRLRAVHPFSQGQWNKGNCVGNNLVSRVSLLPVSVWGGEMKDPGNEVAWTRVSRPARMQLQSDFTLSLQSNASPCHDFSLLYILFTKFCSGIPRDVNLSLSKVHCPVT